MNASEPTMARCGRTDPHGGHAYPVGIGPDGRSDGLGKSGFCGGNQNVITAVVKCPVDGCMAVLPDSPDPSQDDAEAEIVRMARYQLD